MKKEGLRPLLKRKINTISSMTIHVKFAINKELVIPFLRKDILAIASAFNIRI